MANALQSKYSTETTKEVTHTAGERRNSENSVM